MSASSARADGATTFRFLLTHRRRARGYREPLLPSPPRQGPQDETLNITMLWIPPGRFWMGSAASEMGREESEGPQHLVQLQGFFLAQTPITQAQWRVVAQWQPREGEPPWERSLAPEPSRFQGDQWPVEGVSWDDANEFCRRLSRRSGRTYALPSEAQWEYACRAGTTTPFHFGETISSELANYDATASYGEGPKGEYREQTTEVASFPANAWGLHDMHGNVWEWCADHWHDNHEGAPEDGRAWVDEKAGEDERRLLRGGSWFDLPGRCRSAYRGRWRRDGRDHSVGFRLCGFPPGRSSSSLKPSSP
jgi:formylglycine-generating enzyme required for sulfatase activity